MAGEAQQTGAVRCTICGHGIAKRVDLVLKRGPRDARGLRRQDRRADPRASDCDAKTSASVSVGHRLYAASLARTAFISARGIRRIDRG
jgi:hypothetical protein